MYICIYSTYSLPPISGPACLVAPRLKNTKLYTHYIQPPGIDTTSKISTEIYKIFFFLVLDI